MKPLEKEFIQVVQEHKSTIYSVCYMFSKDKDEVEDLFQETLVNMWKGFGNFRGDSSAGTWVWRVCLNTCISSERKKSRRKDTVPFSMNIDLFADTDEDTKQIRLLRKRIGKLGPFDRAIVLLWLENLSYDEIGAIVGITTKNVSVRLDNIELEEMKAQFSLLGEKLKDQKIVNDSLLKQSMKNKLSEINRKVITSIVAAIFVLPFGSVAFISYGLSVEFVIATDVFVAFCVAATIYMHRKLRADSLFDSDLVSASREIQLLKRNYIRWLPIGLTLVILWFVWLVIEGISIGGEEMYAFMIGGSVGFVIGGFFGLRQHRKVLRRADEILKEIDILQRGE